MRQFLCFFFLEIRDLFCVCYFIPGRGAKYCDEYVYVCLSVCLLA